MYVGDLDKACKFERYIMLCSIKIRLSLQNHKLCICFVEVDDKSIGWNQALRRMGVVRRKRDFFFLVFLFDTRLCKELICVNDYLVMSI